MTFIFKNRTIFWDILKWNRRQTKWDGGSKYNQTDRFLKVISNKNIWKEFERVLSKLVK